MSDTLQDLEEREYTRIGTDNYGRGEPYGMSRVTAALAGDPLWSGYGTYELLMVARQWASFHLTEWTLCYREYHRRMA